MKNKKMAILIEDILNFNFQKKKKICRKRGIASCKDVIDF